MTVNVSAATLDRLSDVAIDLARDLTNLYAQAGNDNQLALPLDGEAQANEAFMEEREMLKAQVAGQKNVIETLAETLHNDEVYKDGLRNEVERVNAILTQVAHYNTALQSGLNRMGIRFTPSETGSPAIEVDAAQLAGFMLNL